MPINNEGLTALNKIRLEHGLKACEPNDKLDKAAIQHAEWMAAHYLSHTEGWFQGGLGSRLTKYGFNWSAYAENVAEGQNDVEEACNAWMSDFGHRHNMLGAYQYASIYSCEANNGTKYWVAEFADGE